MSEDLRPYLSRIEGALGVDLSYSACERLGGLTNRNYRLETPQGSLVLRVAGEGTADYLNRAHEEVNARIASRVGVNVEILYFDAADGLSLTRFLPQARTMSSEAFGEARLVRLAGRLLRRLHERAAPFANRFELFEQIDQYQAVLSDKGAELPPGYQAVQLQAERLRRALNAHDLPLVSCHCDPLPENFLLDGERMFLIDFEYSGNNDPMWDLGDFSVEAGFTPEQDEELLLGYFDGPAPAPDRARMTMYQAMCDLLWTLWGVVQHVNGNPAEDFWAYALGRLERCRRLMARPSFELALAQLEALAPGRTNPAR
ncbi:hypothetical protein ABS71_22820 [bacterium SCN 62-11]|nr:phosphotransferase [Candidatus Eremiobacteraeota bacterium]ODT55505.1 MAG: hypothetical protein ABS71_22820 [bacterium SCN 62-11]